MMAVCQLQPNLAVPDWGNVVVQHQRCWVDAAQPSLALSRVCKVLSANQRSWVKGGYNCAPAKQNGRGQFQTRAVATEGNGPFQTRSVATEGGGQFQPRPVASEGGGQFQPRPVASEGGGQFQPRPVATEGNPLADLSPKERQERQWQEFFLDPTQWWDNRPDKKNPRYPDFRHRRSKQPLWLNDRLKPAWVDSLLAMWDSRITERSVDPRLIARIVGEEVPNEAGEGNGAAKPGEAGQAVAAGTFFEKLSGLSVDDLLASTAKSCEDGRINESIDGLDLLVQRRAPVEIGLYYRILKRCIELRDLDLSIRVHGLIVKGGFETNSFLANHLICMYASHGKMAEAIQVFSVVPAERYMWASIIFAHTRHAPAAEAIELYKKMRRSPIKPDNHIFVAILKACATSGDLASGKEVHADIRGSEHEADMFVGSGLVAMYARCGQLEDAKRVFESLRKRDMVSWNSMIVGNVLAGLGQESLAYYTRMEQEGVTPGDRGTFLALLQACAMVGALDQGRKLHAQIKERGGEGDLAVCNCLVNMYARCGSLEEARTVFDKVEEKDLVTWNALLNGYAENRASRLAFQCFEDMKQQKMEPNDITFMGLLVACSHAGAVDEGRQYFKSMVDDYKITPAIEHYTCMADLLGRSGNIEEAEKLMQNAPAENDVGVWMTLLSASKQHGQVEIGRRCFDRVIKLEPGNGAAYILMGSLYADAGRPEDAEEIDRLRKSAQATKIPAKAFIEVNSKVHEFTIEEGGTSDPLSKEKIADMVVNGHSGYPPQAAAAPELVQEESLCGHVEKLTLAYGLLNTPDGTPLLITKNLCMCNDCHSSIKIISRCEKRNVVVRDAHCVHSFVDGACSCEARD